VVFDSTLNPRLDNPMPGILFDMDGVLYEGDSAIAGAAETVAWWRKNADGTHTDGC
jgi:ribonucleotide monophosphatase NagD (HAD superfamily)